MFVTLMAQFHGQWKFVLWDEQFPFTKQFVVGLVVHFVLNESGLVVLKFVPKVFMISKIVVVLQFKFVRKKKNFMQPKVKLGVHLGKSVFGDFFKFGANELIKGIAGKVIAKFIFESGDMEDFEWKLG